MGTLEVDKLDPQSGTALEIGTSGDTATVPSGVTLTVAGTLNVTGSITATDKIDSAHYAAGSIDNEHIADDAINSEHYADGSIDNAHIADDAIDSEHYADGSIDNAHIADDAIDSEHYADGSIDNAHIADDAIDSEHYADGSIDLAHMSSQSVDEDNLYISNSGSNGQFLSKQSGNNGGLTWAAAGGDLSFGGDTFGANKVIGANDAYSLSLETSGNVGIKIDANGHVTLPKQSCAGAYNSASTQTISNQTHTKIAWNTELFDVNADFDTSNYRFVAPVAGKYFVSQTLSWNASQMNTNTRSSFTLRKNNTAIQESFGSPTGSNDRFSQFVTCILNLAASDYLETWIHIDMGGSANSWHGNGGTYSYFFAQLIS